MACVANPCNESLVDDLSQCLRALTYSDPYTDVLGTPVKRPVDVVKDVVGEVFSSPLRKPVVVRGRTEEEDKEGMVVRRRIGSGGSGGGRGMRPEGEGDEEVTIALLDDDDDDDDDNASAEETEPPSSATKENKPPTPEPPHQILPPPPLLHTFSPLNSSHSYSLTSTPTDDYNPSSPPLTYALEVLPQTELTRYRSISTHSLPPSALPPHTAPVPPPLISSPSDATPTDRMRMYQRKYRYGAPLESGGGISTRHVSGRTIDRKHEQFALAAGMMLGIRECVGGVRAASVEMEVVMGDGSGEGEGEGIGGGVSCDGEGVKSDLEGLSMGSVRKRTTLEEECAKVAKFDFPAGTSFVSSDVALPYGYKIKAYAPLIFSKIRAGAGIEKQRFLHSICGDGGFIEFISNAKSGQFFFYCHDGRYMIKTQTHEEKSFLHQILPSYYRYTQSNPHSFVSHFYGMYRVKIPALKICTHFVIMKSVFNTTREIHKIWDLKGSTAGRKASRGDGVHKDLDILEEGRKLHVGPMVKKAVGEQLRKDAKFLAGLHIMDYSMLLGVHLCTDRGSGSVSASGSMGRTRADTAGGGSSFESSPVGMPIDEDAELEMEGAEDGGGMEEVKMKMPRRGSGCEGMMRTNTPSRRLVMEQQQQQQLQQQQEENNNDNGDHNEENTNPNTNTGTTDTADLRQFVLDAKDCARSVQPQDDDDDNDDDDDINDSQSDISDDSSMDERSFVRSLVEGQDREEEEEEEGGPMIRTWLSSSRTFDAEVLDRRGNCPYSNREDGGIECVKGDGTKMLSREIYFGGIIDILQCYNTRKWGETIIRKSLGNSESDISCIDPVRYADRFVEFMEELLV